MLKHGMVMYDALYAWCADTPLKKIGRLLGIDEAVAGRWGRVQASAGRTLPVIDGLLAATALQHDLTLVTRNVKDFAGLGVQLVNPWDACAIKPPAATAFAEWSSA